MEKSKIQTIAKSKTIDYGDKKIERFWLNRNKDYKPETEDNRKLFSEMLANEQDSVICIQTEEIDDAILITEIFNASKRRNRIYIFTNEKPIKLKELTGCCLIRYGVKNIGSFILINPNSNNSQGILFTAPFLESSFASSNIALELDNNQINTLFRCYCNNFWNKATHEIIDNFENAKPVTEPPLDFLPNIKDFCDFEFIKQKILEQTDNLIFTVPRVETNHIVDLSKISNSKFFTNFQNNDFELLHSIERNGNQIFANQNQFDLRLILSENNGSWLIPKTNISSEDNIFALELNDNQKTKLKKIIDSLFENAKYKYHASKSRIELINCNVRLTSDLNNEITIEEVKSIKAYDINSNELLEKSVFENQEPKFLDDNISCKIEYKWNINPFYLPQKTKKAKIYEEWQKIENEFQNMCNQLEKSILESENKNITEKLKRFFLGKKQSLSKYKEILNYLKKLKLSELEISKRKEKVAEFNNLIKNVSTNISKIDTEIKKSEIDIEIEKLKSHLELKKTGLEEFIKTEEQKLKEKEDSKQQNINEFLEKYGKSEAELESFMSELTQKAGKKNRKKNPKEAKDAQKILNELQKIQGFNFRNKFEDEKKKFESEIKKIEQKIQRKEKEKSKIGNETNQQTSLLDVVISGKEGKSKNQKSEFIIPENLLNLPKVGELYEFGNQIFLAIEFWEDYEMGKQESERFNAKLCTKP